MKSVNIFLLETKPSELNTNCRCLDDELSLKTVTKVVQANIVLWMGIRMYNWQIIS